MKIYTRHGNKYVIDHNMHMITGENINPIYYYGEPNILLGFPASFQTDRGVWKTSAIVKIEEGPKNHTYKLFSSTDKQLESFETRYAYSHFHQTGKYPVFGRGLYSKVNCNKPDLCEITK